MDLSAIGLASRGLNIVYRLSKSVALLACRLLVSRINCDGKSLASIIGLTLTELFEELGASYIKVGQILSTRRDLFPEPIILALERLQDRLPPIPFTEASALFREEFGLDIKEAFREFDPIPIASASVASVYRATLHDGRVVAVKVRRRGITWQIGKDLQLLKAIGRLLSKLTPFSNIPIIAIINEVGSCLEHQLDFRREAAANKRLRSTFTTDPSIVIPALVEELCGSSVLTMEFINELNSAKEICSEMAGNALVVAVRALFRMIFVEGLVHCDLHRGNLHFLPDGRVALIDFGFVADVEPGARLAFAAFFFSMATNDGVSCARLTLEVASFTPPGLPYGLFEAEIMSLVERNSRANAEKFQIAEFVFCMFEIQRRFGIVGTTAFTMTIISLLVLEGIAKDIRADLDFQAEALPYILRGSMPSRIRAAGARVGQRGVRVRI